MDVGRPDIKYAVVATDESNILKMEVKHNKDGELTDLREGKRRSHLIGCFFVIDAVWKDRFLTHVHAVIGDFCYCK